MIINPILYIKLCIIFCIIFCTMLRIKSFFCGIIITSIVWIVIFYFYILRNELFSKTFDKTSINESYGSILPKQHRFISRLNSRKIGSNPLNPMKKVKTKRPIEANLINEDPIEDEFQRKQDIKWYNKAMELSAASSDRNLISLGLIKTKEEKRIKDEGYKRHAFNVLISNRIGYSRTIPDTRNSLCKTSQQFVPISDLPNASVIICFFNEALSALLRTVQSVVERSDDRLLHEIILIDDFSDDGLTFRPIIFF